MRWFEPLFCVHLTPNAPYFVTMTFTGPNPPSLSVNIHLVLVGLGNPVATSYCQLVELHVNPSKRT